MAPLRVALLPATLTLAAIFSTTTANDGIAAADSVYLHEVEVQGRRGSNPVVSGASVDFSTSHLRGIDGLADAIRRIPMAELRDYGGSGGLKTVSVRGLGAMHTGVVFDGVPVSDCHSGAVDIGRFNPDNLHSVAVVSGDGASLAVPARVLASGATVYLVSVMPLPGNTPDFSAKFRGGSFGLVNPSGRFSAPLGQRVAIGADGAFSRADNRYPFSLNNGSEIIRDKRNNSQARDAYGQAHLKYIYGCTDLGATVRYYTSTRHLPGPVTLYNPESNEILGERSFLCQATGRFVVSPRVRINAIGKYSTDHSHYTDVSPIYPGGALDERYYQREAYCSAVAAWTPAGKWEFALASDYAFNSLTSNRPQEKSPRRHSLLEALSAKFETPHWRIAGRLLLANYIHEAKSAVKPADHTRLCPSVQGAYSFGNMVVRASFKDVFRMPTFAETSFGVVEGAPDLRPERATEFNLGSTFRLRAWQMDVDAFCNLVTDKIIAIPRNMFYWSMANIGRTNIYGLNFSADGSVPLPGGTQFVVFGAYTFQRVRPIVSASDPMHGRQAAYSPKHTGSASVAWESPWISVGVNAVAASGRYATNSNRPESRLPGFVDLGADVYRSFSLGKSSVTVRLDGHNLLGRQYFLVARYPMPGRSFTASVTYDFR